MNLIISESAVPTSESNFMDLAIPGIETIDLTSYNVLAHFARSTRNVQLLNFMLALDRVDKWAVDYNEAESANSMDIQLFLHDLECFVDASLPVLHRVPREFADILSHLTTTRCMYLIRFVGQRNDQFLDQLGFLLEDDAGQSPDVAAVRRRLEAFGKAKLLGEIFSGKRLTRILQVMGSYSDV